MRSQGEAQYQSLHPGTAPEEWDLSQQVHLSGRMGGTKTSARELAASAVEISMARGCLFQSSQ